MELSYEGVCFDLFGTLVNGDGVANDGAKAALAVLPAGRWAIVTSCGTRLAQALIASAGFPAPGTLVCSNDVVRGKPAPDPYLLASQRLGIAPGRLVAIEDSLEGIAAGRAAGMDVVGIARGRGVNYVRNATAHVDRFDQIAWSLDPDGSIRLGISAR